MNRDIINVTALRSAISAALEDLPPALNTYRPNLQTYFYRIADQHDSIRKAHRRKADPRWAQQKFDQGKMLYRFDESRCEDLIKTIRDQFGNLGKMAVLAQDRTQPMSREACAFFGGLSHRRDEDIEDPGRWAWGFLKYVQLAALKARGHETLREPAECLAGSLVASRCTSLDAIIRLGRLAHNCLRKSSYHWEDFISGKIDIWSLRDDAQLVAVLSIDRATRQVIEARASYNMIIAQHHIHEVALFCRKGGWGISRCDGLSADYAEVPILGPKLVMLGKMVAQYIEWSNAVRIDIGRASDSHEVSEVTLTNLSAVPWLAFDFAFSGAGEIIAVSDPRRTIAALGKNRLRKIVESIAQNQIPQTLVQHRLLALTA